MNHKQDHTPNHAPNNEQKKHELLVVFAGPSGAGKSTLLDHVVSELPLDFSVSATTRAPRDGELNGREYYFITRAEFDQHIADDDFIEHEEVYKGCFYGTLYSELDRIWKNGKYAAFGLDVFGALNLKKKFGDNALIIFVQAPNIEMLFSRLDKRALDSEESRNMRKKKVIEEMEKSSEFDHIIINDDLEIAKREATSVVRSFLNSQSV